MSHLQPESQPRALDPEWQPLSSYFAPLKNLGNIPIQDIRNGVAGIIQTFNEAVPTISASCSLQRIIQNSKRVSFLAEGLTVHEKELTVEDGATIKIRIYVPQKTPTTEENAGFPLLYWHFGGGTRKHQPVNKFEFI